MRTAETRPFLHLFRHENKASTGTCMSIHYQWFNPPSDCMLRSLERNFILDGTRIDTRWNQNWSQSIYILYAKEKALRCQSPPPLSTLQQYPRSIERFPVTSHSSFSYDSCVSVCYLRWIIIVAFSGRCICQFVLYLISCRYEEKWQLLHVFLFITNGKRISMN